jgi:hypothetical protein
VLRVGYVHRLRINSRCQRSRVDGVTRKIGEEQERERGRLAKRQLSLLRSQLKGDLAIWSPVRAEARCRGSSVSRALRREPTSQTVEGLGLETAVITLLPQTVSVMAFAAVVSGGRHHQPGAERYWIPTRAPRSAGAAMTAPTYRRAGSQVRRGVRATLMTLLLWPAYGFVRGEAAAPRQRQRYACRYFPNCRTKPVKTPPNLSRSPWCRDHDLPMDVPVVRRPR